VDLHRWTRILVVGGVGLCGSALGVTAFQDAVPEAMPVAMPEAAPAEIRPVLQLSATLAALQASGAAAPVPPAMPVAALSAQAQPALTLASLAHPALAATPSAEVLRGEPAPPREVFEALHRAQMSDEDIVLLARPVDDAALPPLFAHREEQPMTLASTTKLVTALAALDTLGPQYRWRTRAYLDGYLHEGVLYGDLRIVGGGDARLASTDLVEWFRQMRQRGLAEVRGNIVLDRRVFQLSEADHANTPPPSAEHPRHNWPDALWIDEGKIRVDVANSTAGTMRAMLVVPNGEIEIDNQLQQRRTACADLRQRPRLSLDESATPLRAVLTGEWAADCTPLRLEVAPLHATRFVARSVAAAWHAAGGQLEGSVVDAPDVEPAGPRALPRKPWLVLESPPLGELVRDMNKSSNNLLARHLMLSLADRFPSRPATLDSARRRLDQWLRKRGLADADLHVDNGSGLSYTERGRVRAMVQLLQRAWGGETAQWFRESLPLAGKDGTLANRMRDLGAEALLKTGSLNQARALAGYVRARSGRVYAMAAVINHIHAARGEPVLDAFVEWVVRNG
jgi:D-alanyl-D-alanine carboxypeptidase/D-alanyl-D-alanine-endopeptidase (penicillin-binding protein 4)